MFAEIIHDTGLEPWAKFIILLLMQGGALAILAWLGLKTLPEMVSKLADLRTQDHILFNQRAERSENNIKELSMEVRLLREKMIQQKNLPL